MAFGKDELKQSIIRRLELIERLGNDPELQALALARSAKDPAWWCNTFCWTYDPRGASNGLPAYLPFDLFPRQEELLQWLDARIVASEEGLVEKSRDVGWTWVASAFALNKWLFAPGFKTTFGSRKEVYVDSKGDPDSIFGKIRLMIDRMPHWMVPQGFKPSEHDNFMRLLNPVNGNAITGEAGDNMGRGGRAQPLYAKILTPRGWTTMGELLVGSEVIGADGRPTRVSGIFPQGIKDVYRVGFSDGSHTACCGDHLWRVTTRSIRKSLRDHDTRPRTPRFKVVTTYEMAASLTVKRGDSQVEFQYQIPLVEPIKFKRQKAPIDPYLLGALLGDGSLSNIDKTAPGFTTADGEMLQLLAPRLPKDCGFTEAGWYEYRIADRRGKVACRKQNPLKVSLRSLGLDGHTAHDKFIPDAYKFGSPEIRLEVLRGLLDTDGWVADRGTSSKVCFSSVSRDLAEDVQFLVQSLGGTASISSRAGKRRKFPGGREYDCAESFQVTISMPGSMNPFRMARKADKYRPRGTYQPRRSVVSVEPIGAMMTQCITVDAPDQLYVTDECIVTHNSTLYVVDEGAFIEHAEKVDAAIVANANARIWASSVNGTGNVFFRKRHSGHIPVFRFHWSDDPRKDQDWAEAKQKELSSTPATWAAEYDIDYAASVEGICIPAKWVESSRKLARALKPEPQGIGRAGLDVGGGRAKSVLVPKFGPVVLMPTFWQTVDNIHVTHEAIETARQLGVGQINYDASGLGNTVTSTLVHANTGDVTVSPINVGVPPTETLMPDGRMATEWFGNLKAQIWWAARDAFKATHEHVRYLEGHDDGLPHPEDEWILLPDCNELIGQISLVKWFRNEAGKIVIETKKQLATRGVPSPDYAEALVLNFAQGGSGFHFASI